MAHSNISIFVPHAGCPQQCSFCNQKTISGAQHQPTAEEVHEVCQKALSEVADRKNCEIAFFGGSFTAIERSYMLSLLKAASEYVGADKFSGIRISTRPDCIDSQVLDILKAHGVTSIELGAQSMKDEVLTANDRGHTARDTENASGLIKEYGFELGLQIIPGLYKSSEHDEIYTYNKILEIHPDTIRIYPIVVLEGTKLGELYKKGEYPLMPFDDMVRLCAKMLIGFEKEGIGVIKCGLHASDGVSGKHIAGYYHPAFRELCQGMIYREKIERQLDGRTGNYEVFVNPSCVSQATGQKKSNINYFKSKNINIKITGKGDIDPYNFYITKI